MVGRWTVWWNRGMRPAPPPGSRLGSLPHRRAAAVVSGVALAGSYVLSLQDPVPGWELDLTEAINDVPDVVADVLYPVMQLGTLGGPIVVAVGIVAWRRDWSLGAATVAAGLVAWFGAKGIKRVVGRGRPGEYLPEIVVREGDGTGLGFVSGHSAVAMSAAVMAMVALPRRWRPVAGALAVLVGLARIVHGVHLPADVIGGWSFGALVSLGVLALLDLVERGRRASRPRVAT